MQRARFDFIVEILTDERVSEEDFIAWNELDENPQLPPIVQMNTAQLLQAMLDDGVHVSRRLQDIMVANEFMGSDIKEHLEDKLPIPALRTKVLTWLLAKDPQLIPDNLRGQPQGRREEPDPHHNGPQ